MAAYRGRLDEARDAAAALISGAEETTDPFLKLIGTSVLGFVELAADDPAAAWSLLEPLPRAFDERGTRASCWLPPAYPNAIEAAVAVGELERASALADRLRRIARRMDAPIGLCGAARGAALVSAAAGATDIAVDQFKESIAQAERGRLPFERARSVLALGIAERRDKRRADARRSIEHARDEFIRLGTPSWAERAREELGRVAGRARSGIALTASEARVAELVAEGKANKEVAAALFVSVKTVEASLTRIYAKLRVRSRTELMRLYAERETSKH